MGDLQDRCQLQGPNQVPGLDQDVVLFRQRRQRVPAVEVVVVELGGQGAGPEWMVEERIGVVAVKVLLHVERSADGEDLLLAKIGSR